MNHRGTDGFVATDALVALAILATMIGLALGAVTAGRRAATVATETRAAEALMTALLDERVRAPGLYRGQTGRFDWLAKGGETTPTTASRRRAGNWRPVEATYGRSETRFGSPIPRKRR